MQEAIAAVAPGKRRREGILAEEDLLLYWKGASERELFEANQDNEKETTGN